MSSEKYLVVAILALASFVVVAKPSNMDLSMAMTKTICKINVTLDVNEDRIPKVIKVLKCADDQKYQPTETFTTSNGDHNQVKFSCVEMVDSLIANDTIHGTTYTMVVPVGCVFIKEKTIEAISVK